MKKLSALIGCLLVLLVIATACGGQIVDTSPPAEPTPSAAQEEETATAEETTAPEETAVVVSTGDTHSMLVKSDMSLWVWGENSFGQLGNGKRTTYGDNNEINENNDSYVPIKILEDIISVAAGDGFSLAVNKNNELLSWGNNNYGQLGDGTTESRSTPMKIMEDVIHVDACRSISIAIKSDNSLWVWGSDVTDGEFYEETGKFGHHTSPVKIMDNVKNAAVGLDFVLMLDNENCLHGIGKVANLGIGDSRPNERIKVPVLIMTEVKDISVSSQQSYVITFDNELYGWGANGFEGLVGCGSDEFYIYSPQFISGDVKTMFSGNMLLKTDDSLWIWGNIYRLMRYRYTEDGETYDSGGAIMGDIIKYGKTPVKIMDNVIAASGYFHYMAVDDEGSLFTWGNNQFGQLGRGKATVYEIEIIEEMEDEEYYVPNYLLVEDHDLIAPEKNTNISDRN